MMNHANTLNTLHEAITSSFLTEEKQAVLLKQLDRIRKRIDDDKIYLGLVGEFSTGKSTLINSLIGENLFVTNALQGTTTTITKLEYGSKANLKIEYITGQTQLYSHDKTNIMKRYKPEVYNGLSAFAKLKMRLWDMCHKSRSDEYMLQIFDQITTSDEISQTLSEVTVYHPSPLLSHGIVIVDTPGTDSLTPAHAETTRRAIKDICDIALVIVPSTHPLTQTLTNYLEDNLGDVADKCLYFVTKIELVHRPIERLHLLKGVSQRISSYLDIDDPQVVPAPSLVSLEEKGLVQKTSITAHLTAEERSVLCANFETDIRRIIEKIHSERDNTINDKIERLSASLRDELQADINAKDKELNKELEETRIMRVKPLSQFMEEFYSSHEVYQYSYMENYICNAISASKSEFKNFIYEEIDACQTKDGTQATMESETVVANGKQCFDNCYNAFKSILAETLKSYTDNFNEFKASFTKMFSIDAIDFTYSILNKPDWQRRYKFSYNKWGLTTFLPLRMFKSLAAVKQQMKDDVGPQIDKEFLKMQTYYVTCAQKAYKDIEQQMDEVKKIFIRKYEKIIAERIRQSNEKEAMLNGQLSQLRANLERISSCE